MINEDDQEYREEDNQRRHDQKYTPWIDPRDPNYIGPEGEDDSQQPRFIHGASQDNTLPPHTPNVRH